MIGDVDDESDEFQKVIITAIEKAGVAGRLKFYYLFKEDYDRNADYDGFEDYKRPITIIRRHTIRGNFAYIHSFFLRKLAGACGAIPN